MNEDIMLQTGFFDLHSFRGLGALDERQMEDSGITKRNGVYFNRDGHQVADLEEPSLWSLFRAPMFDFFRPATLKRA